MAVLELENVVKRFGDTLGVGPISLRVEEGEFLSLLGPSGCGKTTALRCIAGFEDLSEGSIKINGQTINDKPPHKREVGMVFQQHALFPHLSVFGNVAFGLRQKKVPKKDIADRVHRSLELMQLKGFDARYPHQLSGGQQQRVALARTLVTEPSIVLFDEPLSALDLKLRIQMRNEIKLLHRTLRKTCIYVTHDQIEALTLSNRIAVMFAGKIEQIGAPREIYESPTSPFVADFIGESNMLRGNIVASDGLGLINCITDRGLRLVSDQTRGLNLATTGSEVSLAIRQERITIRSVPRVNVNCFKGIIEECMYLGEGVQFLIHTNEGHQLMAVNRTNEEILSRHVGETVWCHVPFSDVKVIPMT